LLCYRKVRFSLINLTYHHFQRQNEGKKAFLYVLVHLISSTGWQIVMLIY
jgi:hypothetical protein